MRILPVRLGRATALLAGLLLAGPARASFGWGGDLGFSLNQSNVWSDTTSSSSTVYTFNGGLHLDYSPFSPGVLDLGATASYLGYRTVDGSASDGLNYSLRLSALRQTPLNLTAMAFRSTTDFTADRNSGRVGTTRVDGLSATASLAVTEYPFLLASWRSSTVDNRPVGSASIQSQSTGVNATIAQSVDSLYYQLSYDTTWASGDYAETNYRSHNTQFSANAQLDTYVLARASANYTLRLPTVDSPLNPRIDTQSFTAGLVWSVPYLANSSATYSYSSALFEAPGSPLRQLISHSLSASVSKSLSSEVWYDLSGSASSAQERLGTTEAQVTGEQAAGGLRWAREAGSNSLQASATGSVGRTQRSDNVPASTGWGIGGNFNVARPTGTWYSSAGLGASYSDDGGARAGQRSRLSAVLSTTGIPFGWYFRSMLTAGYSLNDSVTFGKTRQATARLEANASRGGFDFHLDAAVTDDLSEVLVAGAPPGSLLAPVEFNTQNRYAILVATLPAIERLSISLLGRTLQFSSPGRPTAWESGLSVTAAYGIGAFYLSLYDQVTTGGAGGISNGTQNLLFFSVARHFGR